MPLSDNSLAVAVGSGVKNTQFTPSASNLPRKILIIGTIDPAKESLISENVPFQVLSPEDVGDKTGFGFMAHRLAVQSFRGGKGTETWLVPQFEAAAGTQASGNVTFSATGLQSGIVYLYIAGIPVLFSVSSGIDAEAIVDLAVLAINANSSLPVTAVKNGTTTEQLDITSKSEGEWGDDISISFNRGAGQSLPTGCSVVVVDMSSGAGLPDIQDALDGTGTGDDANENYFTDVIHGYGYGTTTLDSIANYVGQGNDFTGLYSKTVSRPFRVLTGDVTPESTGLTALIAIGNGRKQDRANGIIAVPGSVSHPSEIAAQTIGHMARISNSVVAAGYADIILEGIDAGDKADRWTSNFDNKDLAVKAGISPTRIKNGAVVLQNVLTFYHPDNVAVTSNGYREMVHIAKLQNILAGQRQLFESEKYSGAIIVLDVAKVSNVADRLRAIDVETVKDDLVALYRAWEGRAWIADAKFSINALKEAGAVTIRTGGDGFNITNKVVLSGVNNIMDVVTLFDTSFAVLS